MAVIALGLSFGSQPAVPLF